MRLIKGVGPRDPRTVKKNQVKLSSVWIRKLWLSFLFVFFLYMKPYVPVLEISRSRLRTPSRSGCHPWPIMSLHFLPFKMIIDSVAAPLSSKGYCVSGFFIFLHVIYLLTVKLLFLFDTGARVGDVFRAFYRWTVGRRGLTRVSQEGHLMKWLELKNIF